MPREMRLDAAGPACAEAVTAFAAEVAEATALSPVVTAAEDAVDVAFLDGGPPQTALRVEWARRNGGGLDAGSPWDGDDEADGDTDGGDVPEHTLRHYWRTMAALARNDEAAAAFLRARKPDRRLGKRRRLHVRRRREKTKGKTHAKQHRK